MKNQTLVTILAAASFLAAFNPGPAPAQKLDKAWELTDGFIRPESALYDRSLGVLYVTSMGGRASEKDGTGYISRVSPEGEVLDPKWVSGLNAPKGMALVDGSLYVSDIDELVRIDVAAGEISARYPAEGAMFLNDVAADAAGRVYVSDSRTNVVYRLREGTLDVWLQDDEVRSPNGLWVEDGTLLMAAGDASAENAGGARYLQAISLEDRAVTPVRDREGLGGLDAIVPDGRGGYFLSDWSGGRVLHYTRETGAKEIEVLTQGTADLDYVPESGMLFLPVMMSDRLIAYRVNWEASEVNLIRWHRRIRIAPDQTDRAAAWAAGITALVNDRYPERRIQVYVQRTPAGGTIHWFADVDDPQAFGREVAAMEYDPEFQAMMEQATGLFADSSPVDTIMERLE